jgi:hypothetical protein
MSNGEGTQRYSRTRGNDEPQPRSDSMTDVDHIRMKKTVEILSGMAEDEDDTAESKVDSKGVRRLPAIRFAQQ